MAYIAYDKLAWLILINNLGSNHFRRAYYLLARKYHPDKWNGETSNILKSESEERFKAFQMHLKILNWPIVWPNY